MFTPRPYQIELVERALFRNTIVCLNSPVDKPFIVLSYLREIITRKTNLRTQNYAVVLFESEQLAQSFGKMLQRQMNIAVKVIVKHQGSDEWSKLLNEKQILVTTHKLIADALSMNSGHSSKIGVIVVDDCHLVIEEEEGYVRTVVKLFSETILQLCILGITTCLLKNSQTALELKQNITAMETLLHAHAETATDLIGGDQIQLAQTKEQIILCGNVQTDKGTAENSEENINTLSDDIRKLLLPTIDWLEKCQINDEIQLVSSTGDLKDGEGKATNLSGILNLNEICAMSRELLSKVILVLNVLGTWCAYKLVSMILRQLQKSLQIVKLRENAKLQLFLLQHLDSHLRAVYTLCHRKKAFTQKKIDTKLITPKVTRLLQVLREFKPIDEKKNEDKSLRWWEDSEDEDDDDITMDDNGSREVRNYTHTNTLCGIVFVDERYVAMMLHRLLKEVCKEDKNLQHVLSGHIMSSEDQDPFLKTQSQDDAGMHSSNVTVKKNKQEEVLRNFRSHEINLLVSTNIVEETVDLPKCNLVVRFDVPNTFRSYIQSKSRTRGSNSTYIMLVHVEEQTQFMSKLQEFKRIEQILQRSSPIEQAEPTDDGYFDDVDSELDDEQNLIPPYFSGPHSCVTLQSAIHVVNRYCSRLPNDTFTHLTARCDVFEEREITAGDKVAPPMYKCKLQLPINSHVRKPIMGPLMPSIQLAKKAVAMETCKLLHMSGELDDHFMPIGKETVKYAEELDPWPPEKSRVPGRPGTTKRRQTYDKEVPDTLNKCLPQVDAPLFLYEIRMKLASLLPDELNVRARRLHAPEETTRCFGILTTRPLPKSCAFPVFTRSGEETVEFHICQQYLKLQEHQIKMIRSFHHFVFSDMLRVDHAPLSFKPESANMQFYVVVINQTSRSPKLDVDWTFLCKVANKRRMDDRMSRDPWFRHQMSRMNGKKVPFKFQKRKYEDGVVVAKYRSPEQPNRFYVAEIKSDLNPQSSFPSAEYESFHQYYKIKYGLDITCLNQPLLDVDHTSSRLNLLTPRYMNQKGKVLPHSSLEKKRAKYENLTNRQILIPELCILHCIPASLWRKAVCLPSIIYRLSQLLIAEELRCQISFRSGIASCKPRWWESWPPLDFGWKLEQFAILEKDDENDETLSDTDTFPKDEITTKPDEVVTSSTDITTTDTLCKETIMKADKLLNIKTFPTVLTDEHFDKSTMSTMTSKSETAATASVKIDIMPTTQYTEDEASSETKIKNFQLPNGDKQESDLSSSGLSSNYDSEDYHDCFDLSDTDMQLKFEKDTLYETRNPKKQKKKKIKRKKQKPRLNNMEPTYTISNEDFAFIHEEAKRNENKDMIGPSPALILQALTLSNASDGFNLERLEMLGDSFLKHSVTVYLYCTYPHAHEGKLSYMRSKKVSNYNLYRIGLKHKLPGKMNALIFDPAVNWLPPCYTVGKPSNIDDVSDSDSNASYESEVEIGVWSGVPGSNAMPKNKEKKNQKAAIENEMLAESDKEDGEEIFDEDEVNMIDTMLGECIIGKGSNGIRGGGVRPGSMYFTDHEALRKSQLYNIPTPKENLVIDMWAPKDAAGKIISSSDPLMLDLHTQHSLADKSIADCVEAILGAYLTTCGQRAAQFLLCYFGLTVLPVLSSNDDSTAMCYGELIAPENVLIGEGPETISKLSMFTVELAQFEKDIGYEFNNKGYLLQAFTHASYYYNNITDCYQCLEFLGDAILDYLITRRLFNDPMHTHSPGALTDLRSALVNNTIFASLAVRHNFHKYFKSLSPDLHQIIDDFVYYQQEQEETQGMDAQLARRCYDTPEDSTPPFSEFEPNEEEDDEEEDVEVPKALGDIFESVAGAIYMDSGMQLDAVWNVYEPMMSPLIEKFSKSVPRAPVRELLEMEPETVKFSWAEKRCDGKVRVTVEVIGKGTFKGVGRSYRIAKSAAARRALRFLKAQNHE